MSITIFLYLKEGKSTQGWFSVVQNIRERIAHHGLTYSTRSSLLMRNFSLSFTNAFCTESEEEAAHSLSSFISGHFNCQASITQEGDSLQPRGGSFKYYQISEMIHVIIRDFCKENGCLWFGLELPLNFLRMSDQSLMVEEEEKDLPFYMTYVPEFFRKKCELELKETPERKKQCLRELRILLKNDDVAKDVCFHEDLLIQYLRHCKYNTEKALKQNHNLLAFRRKEAKHFESVPDEYFSTKASTKFTSILPKRSPDGCTVVLCRLAKWDPNELEFDDFVRIMFITYLQIFRDPMTQINGFKIIHDFAGTRFEHLKYGTPRNLYLFYYVSLYCIPGRYKEIHLINETPVLRIMWSIIKRFLSAKIRSRKMCSEAKRNENEDMLPFQAVSLPKHVLRKCEDELNETPDRRAKALQELRSMLQNNPETTGINFNADFLTQFLRRNKYRLKDAYQNVLNLVNITRKESLFKKVSHKYLDSPSTGGLFLLPERCPDGCAVVITQMGKWNPNEVPFETMKSLFATAVFQLLRDPITQINGIKFIHDFKGASVQHLKFCSPRNMRLLYHSAINCLPGRYKAVHFVNESFVLRTVLTLIKPFLTEKLKNRMILHSSCEGLFDYFPRSMLPAELGGTLLDNDIKNWMKIAHKCHEGHTIEGQPNFY